MTIRRGALGFTPVLVWDEVGSRFYETGIDRGVLAFQDGTIVGWSGLIGVEEGYNSELKSFYLDGVKFLEHVTPGDFVGKLSAFTYPEEFERALGVEEITSGLRIYEQPPENFNLSYRTGVGSDLDGDYGYKIHLFYNLSVVPDPFSHQTESDQASAQEFGWSVTGVPATVFQKRSTTHITISSLGTHPSSMNKIEQALYGSEIQDPYFPSILEVRQMFGELGGLSITVLNDGRWIANDPSNDFITLVGGDPTHFQIEHANATFMDTDLETYQITDTPNPLPTIE